HQILDGYWKDTGTLEALLEGNRLVLEALERRVDGRIDSASRREGGVVMEAGAELVNSTVRGPSIIGARTRIIDSFVGPFTAIDHDCVIEATDIEHSV